MRGPGRRRPPTARAPAALVCLAVVLLAAGCAGRRGPATLTADGYRVVFPAPPRRTTTAQRVGRRTVTVVTYTAALGAETDAVSSSPLVLVPAGAAAVEARLAGAVAGSVRALGGQQLSERRFAWLGHRAIQAVIATTDRLVRLRVVIDGARLDVVEGISRGAQPSFTGYRRLVATWRFVLPAGSASAAGPDASGRSG